MVTTGKGLAALPKKLVSKILANEYIDFTELPPAKGKARNVPQSLEGQVLVVQAADLMQAWKLIPDLATWVQCFALYATTLLTHQPNRVSEMMAYQSIIARANAKYRWPSWVVYDQNFRQAGIDEPPILIVGESGTEHICAMFHRTGHQPRELVCPLPRPGSYNNALPTPSTKAHVDFSFPPNTAC